MKAGRRSFIQAAAAMAAVSSGVFVADDSSAQTSQPSGTSKMPYQAKPMPFDPKAINGISEKVLVSHYQNNYVGAVNRLNAIGTQLAELDFAKAPNFVINGLKREELVASNSMILHEIYFDGLGGGTNQVACWRKPSRVILAAWSTGAPSSQRWARRKVAVRAG